MTVAQLTEAMKYYLKGYNDEGVVITSQTIHNTVLSEDDGIGDVNSKVMYFHSITLYLHKAGQEPLNQWPSGWMEMTLETVAEKLLQS